MKLSQSWLKADFGLDIETDLLARRLTMAGLEVDSILDAAAYFSHVVVGEVTKLEAHPNADKLRIAEVNVGSEVLQIVCGAPNVAQGVKIPVALISAVLPGNFKIKKSKLRGVESFGMLCSAKELGMSEDSSGLLILPEDAPVGKNIREYLLLDDKIIDIDITPNRADAFSMIGLAREASVLFNTQCHDVLSDIQDVETTIDNKKIIENDARSDCPLYLSRVIRGIDNHAKTPAWMLERLRRAGVRAHSPVVDVTNYVMMLLGTPMHGFDADKMAGEKIVIRRAQEKESLKLINDNKANLDSSVLVIADEEKPLAIAGVMGGADSACQLDTKNIVLEAAWFHPVTIAGKAREFGLSSDSAQRFERGVDYELQKKAIELASKLIIQIAGGNAGPTIESLEVDALPQHSAISLSLNDLERRLGKSYDHVDVAAILKNLGCEVSSHGAGWQVTSPSWRFDIQITADLVEEIARIDGYDKIANVAPKAAYQKETQEKTADQYIRHQLANLGFFEAITYSFIDKKTQTLFNDKPAVLLQNPISSEMGEMRMSLLPGLVSTLIHNRHRQNNDVCFFELGTVFLPKGEKAIDCKQPYYLAGVLSGNYQPEQWSVSSRTVDFFDVKGVIEKLLFSVDYDIKRSDKHFLHPGQGADIIIDGKVIGYFGNLHPETKKALGDKGGDIFIFEIDTHYLMNKYRPQYQAIGKFPQIRRDLALVVDKEISAESLEQSIKKNANELLKRTFWFDLFSGGNMPKEKKSLAIALIFQSDDKTLQDEEVDGMITHLVAQLHQDFGVELR